MSSAARLDTQSIIALAQLCDSVKHDTKIRRAETDGRIALAKQRNLEWQLGLRSSASDLWAGSSRSYTTIPHFKPTKKNSRSRLVRDVTVPAVTYKPRRSAAGLRSFHYSIEPIPKSSFFRQLASGTKIGPGAGEARIRYTTRTEGEQAYLLGDRVQSDFFGRPLIITNISPSRDPNEIAEFYSLVEENERDAKPDKALIVFNRHPEVWRRVVDDPACEPAVLKAYLAVKGQGSVEVELVRGADALLELMKRHGFVPADKVHSPERQQELNGLKLTKGRGGRIQWRIVVALPVEFSARQRRRAAEAICRRLERRGAMYAAVIHEPVATNHQNNYHAHIDVYDRPCRPLFGDARDLDNVAPKWKAEIKRQLEAGELQHLKRQWDFAAVREYRSSSGNRTLHKPFRAKKSGAFRAFSFPKRHRAEIAGIINAIAVAGGHGRLYNPRTYGEMKIAKEPDEQLGPRRHGLEAKGAPTNAGMRNEERHAEADRHLIETAHQQRLKEITQQQRAFDSKCDQQGEPSSEQKKARDEAHAALADLKLVARARYRAELSRLEMQRQLSRPRNMIRAAGRAKRLGEDPRGELATLGEEARHYWRDWQKHNQPALDELRELSAFAAREGELQAASERLQAEALRPVLMTNATSGLAESVEGATWRSPEPVPLPVTPASIVESEAPLLLGRRFKRIIEEAHHRTSETVAEPKRNIMVRGSRLDGNISQAGSISSVEPTPPTTSEIDQANGKTENAMRQTWQPAAPMNSDRSDAVPAASGSSAPSELAQDDDKKHAVSKVELGTASQPHPSVFTAQPVAAGNAPAALSGQPAISGSEPPPKEPGDARGVGVQPVAEQGGDPLPIESLARDGLNKESGTDASGVLGASSPAARRIWADPPQSSETTRRDLTHAEMIAAYLRKLEANGVLLSKNKATSEIHGSFRDGSELSLTDKLLFRWGGLAFERLATKQLEIRQVQDYLLRHGEALARTGKQPGPRCQRLMKSWRDEPKLQKALAWFAAEQEEAIRRKAADLAAQNARAVAGRIILGR
ncbi:hypothetical protein GCM10022280_09130 [Sphingomonas swuensis]|uniref:MobA/MobL protein domain-containing protein n=1 Tax=Sphingomonas swuensis TaxID=977800 RepID=A0ABP7SL38_9SPHN